MAPKRSYKKRSYKKRRAIRKLKTTLRRKIQRGGITPEQKLMISILKLVLGNIEPFVRICVLLATMSSQMGGRSSKSSRLYQTGGALSQNVKDELKQKLLELRNYFDVKQKKDVVDCIDMIQSKVDTQTITPENITVPEQTIEDELTSQLPPAPAPESALTSDTESTSRFEKLTKFKEVITKKVLQKIESKVNTLTSILTRDEYQCIQTIKTAVLEDFRKRIENSSIMGSVSKGKDFVMGKAGEMLQGEAGQKVMNMANVVSQSGMGQKATKFLSKWS